MTDKNNIKIDKQSLHTSTYFIFIRNYRLFRFLLLLNPGMRDSKFFIPIITIFYLTMYANTIRIRDYWFFTK